MHLPVNRTWFFCHSLVPDVPMQFDLCLWPQFQGPKVRVYKSNPRPICDRFVWVVRSNNTTHWATPIYCMPAFSRLSLLLDDLWMGQKIYNLIVLIKTFHLIYNRKTFQEFWLVCTSLYCRLVNPTPPKDQKIPLMKILNVRCNHLSIKKLVCMFNENQWRFDESF